MRPPAGADRDRGHVYPCQSAIFPPTNTMNEDAADEPRAHLRQALDHLREAMDDDLRRTHEVALEQAAETIARVLREHEQDG